MNDFFAKFHTGDFVFNHKTQPELEFLRLQAQHGWSISSTEYVSARREFLVALVAETSAPVHSYFVLGFPDFAYDSRGSPRGEFDRLRAHRGWKSAGRPCRRARRLFLEAFESEFDSDLDVFFRGFATFDYNPRCEPKAEFERLRTHMKWKKRRFRDTPADQARKAEYMAVRDEFFEAFVGVFSYFFGLTKDYHNWEYLCGLLGVNPIPATAEECEKALDPFHVNIYNLLDHVQEQTPIIFFRDLEELTAYSWGENPMKNELIYPLHAAQGNSLKYLLRRIGKRPRKNA